MKQVLKCFNVVTMITLLLSIILPSPSAFATEINKKSWDELQGNDVKIKAEQVNAEIYKGEVAEREHVFQYTIENTGATPIQELVLKQNNENEITFPSQSVKVNGEKLPENKVADFYVEEKDKGGKVLSSNLKIKDLKSHEKMTVLIKARRAQHFNKEYKQKISVQKDQLQIGNMSVDVEGIPSEDKVEANTDDEADSSKKEIGSPADAKSKEVDGKLKVSAGDKNKPTANTELVKQPVDKDEKKLEKEAENQSDAKVQAASENASKVQMQTGDKQGFGDPLYSTITAGNLVQTGNVTLGLTTDHYGRQSMGYKTNKMTVDVDNDDSTFNSSTGAFPNIPAGSKVKKAYLFWTAAMGLPGNIADRKVTEDQVRQPVKMKMGNKEYADVTADSIRKADYLPYISNYSGSGAGYVAYADVTNVIAQQGISQTLTVANVPQIKDVTGGGYYWGNWNLILVYENYKETVKDMKIWEGLVSQKSTAWTDISVNKINTPKEGAFKAKFSYFSSQGDPAEKDGYAYDYGEYDFGAGYIKIKNINGKDNDANDSSMTEVQVDGTNEFVTKKYPGYNPDWTNSFSTDIHTYHLEGPTQVKNDLKEAKMRFRANGGGGDIYVLNNATFVTEHNAPNLQVDKKALDSAGKEVKEIKAGEEFTYQIEVKNDTKNNQAPVSNVKGFDKLDDRLEYVPGSIQYISGSNKGNKTDNASDDEAEFVNNQIDFRVGEGANAKDGGVLKPGESAIITFKVKVKASVQSDTTIKNIVAVKGKDSTEVNYETTDDANVTVTLPKEVPGEIEARKIASNKTPKLGDEVEYRITFKNKTKDGRLDVLTIEDELPSNLEYVKDSLKAEGAKPEPVELKFENGKVMAKYPEIMDMEERSIVFKTKVKETAKIGEEIVNKATVSDKTNPPKDLEEKITPHHKAGKIAAKKKATNKKPKLGEEVEYQISFKNTVENGKLDAVTIEDEIPANLEFVQGSERAEGAEPNPVELKVENGKVIAKYPEITDTKERSISFKVKVKEEVTVGKKIINKATIDDSQNKPVNPTAEIIPQYKDGKLEAKKMVNNETPKLGEEVEYRISFKNTVEHGKLTEVKIEDDLPNGLEYVKDSVKAVGAKPAPVELKFENGKVMAKYPEITDTKERSITFKVKVKGKVSDWIVNEAIVSDTKHPPETPTAEIIPQHKDGKVKAKKTVNNETPKLGEEVEYRISFKNTVEDGKLAEVKIEDTLPEGLEYVENSVKAEGSKPDPVELKVENGKVMAKYPEITDTEERSITFKVKIKEEVKVGKKIVNKAIIDDTKNEPETPTAEITPQHKDGKVEAKKTVNNETPKLGEEVEYRISFKNTVENGKLAELKIEDDLPNGLEYVKDSLRAEGSKPDPVELKVKDGKVIAKYPEITDTEERSIVFKAKVKEEFKVGEGIVNKVVVDDTKDPTTSEVTITPEYKDGKLKAEKFVNNKKPKLGEEVEYRISFKNTVENGKLVEVKVEDEIPAGLEFVENSLQAEGFKPSPVELKFENGKVMAKYLEIADTKERSIIFKVKVKEEAEIGKEIVNKAIVVDTKNEPEEPRVEITPQYKDGKIAAQKVANNHKPKLGEEVEYRISFKNTIENGKLAEVNIKDALPNGLEYVEGSITAEGSKPKPVELQVKNNKVMAKYPEITDTEERSIVFKAKVKESAKVGEEIVNEAIVDDTKNLPEEPYVPITPQYKDGKIEARKEVSNREPKLGEEIEYRIIFNNTVKDGKLVEVKIEDKIPAGLEFVEGSEKAEGEEPKPVELKVENGKVMAKYSEIMDTKERSIVFKVKVKDSVTIGKDITNKAIIHVDDPNHPITEPTAKITPQYKDGKIAAHKKVNNHKPKLGEEIEYRISFNNTVKDGQLAEVKIEDEIPSGLEYVKNSLKAEGDKPAPVELKEEAGKVSAKYENITDMKERSIIFKVKVKDSVEVDKAIVNKAIIDDTKNPPERPEVDITPQHKDGKFKANKKVSKKDPKLGEEVEYRISFNNTVENGKLAEVKIEDQLPNGLEYVKDSLKAEGNEPNPVELKEEAGKITAKYENITDTAERSIIFKVKVTEAVKVGKKIVNTAIVDDDNPKNPPQKPEAIITPEYKDGKLKAEKTVNNPAPKLGEEVEYRITFRNVVEHGKVAKVKIKDELPTGLEFVEGSERAEGENPKPLYVKVKNSTVLAEYPEITDMKERSIVFKVKVKDKAKIGEAIVNTAVVEDTINPPEKPNVAIQPQHKDGALQAEKTVSNHEPKLGEEVEYRISFENTVENGKLTEVKVEDEIPAGLEYVQDSIKSDGPEPNPVELKVENGKVTAKYPEITDTKKRSIIFKAKVQETVQVGKEIINKAVVDDNNPTNPPVESLVPITPQYKDGKLEARKEVSNHEPKLGEEIEYRITFNGIVDGGKLVDVKIEDEIPSGLEYVKDSLKAVGDKPVPTELKVENGKVTVKYPEITDTKERSIIFKVKVKESVKVGEEITNKAIIHVDDPNHPVMEPTATIKPEYKDGKVKATKTVSNKEPKLGEEIEYRISFENTVENGKLAEVKIEDEIPAGLEYVQDSIRFEGAEPNPVELKMEFGKVIAKYLEITDTKERSIIFKAKVKAAPSKGITNRAIVDDRINTPLEPTVTILPKTKEDFKIPEDPKEPEVKPEDPKEPKDPEMKPEDPKEPKEPEVKPEDPKEPKEPEVKPEDPKEPKEPEVKPEDPKEPKEPEVKPEDPKEPKEPEVKPEDPKDLKKPEVRLEKLNKDPQVKVEKELPKTGAAHPWMMSVGAGISFLVGGVLFVLGRRRKQ
ncbi:isopeptide-forming domain-containing fimbrial protein [Bacillus thuringiensis]|uniref:isopeptide-forming domain-containing fimbrial protein n=1 Tax=Bacillus thuringiensis TaxID=1428 RepID=UPI000BF31F2A|nr:isopeptide-forming domain-containing fimbrial protein [Bacillus thuringiensis]PEV27500.1 cell surface protein [Bacillus thuringiensis]